MVDMLSYPFLDELGSRKLFRFSSFLKKILSIKIPSIVQNIIINSIGKDNKISF